MSMISLKGSVLWLNHELSMLPTVAVNSGDIKLYGRRLARFMPKLPDSLLMAVVSLSRDKSTTQDGVVDWKKRRL